MQVKTIALIFLLMELYGACIGLGFAMMGEKFERSIGVVAMLSIVLSLSGLAWLKYTKFFEARQSYQS